jgi:hypothetical protein
MPPTPEDPLVHWRRNRALVKGLVLGLLAAVLAVVGLFFVAANEKQRAQEANGRYAAALVLADQLKAQKDELIRQAAKAKPGSSQQTQALKQLVKTTTVTIPGAQGVQGLPGVSGVSGLPGVNGVNGAPGSSGSPGAAGSNGVPGPQGAPGADGAKGDPGSNGANGANGVNGQDGSSPSGFTFTTSDGTTYDCRPDGNGHYTCTPRSIPSPTPDPEPTPAGATP